MALASCADCGGAVSTSARSCIHCGAELRRDAPGAIGIAVRVIYYLLCLFLVAVGVFAFREAAADRGLAVALLVPAVVLVVWVVMSASAAVLLYVTRLGRTEPVRGALAGQQDTRPPVKARTDDWNEEAWRRPRVDPNL